MNFSQLYTTILSHLFPPTCFSCWNEWAYICKECHKDLCVHKDLCPSCHRFSQYWKTCLNCFRITSLDWVFVAFVYQWAIKKIIQAIKYQDSTDCIPFISKKLSLLLSTIPLPSEKTVIITSVPLHWRKKLMIRWYNQSELLGKSVSFHSWYTYQEYFKKIRRTRSQTYFKKEKRASNIAWSFGLIEKIEKDSILIIVDDVLTTGSTLNELAILAKQQQPSVQVFWLTIARRG